MLEAGFEDRLQAPLAGAQLGRARLHLLLEQLVVLAQGQLGLFQLRDVATQADVAGHAAIGRMLRHAVHLHES